MRQRLAFYEKQFCAAETDKRMKGMAFRAFYALVRTRVVEEIKRCKGREPSMVGVRAGERIRRCSQARFLAANIIS